MTTEQQDWNDSRKFEKQPPIPQYFELVHRVSKGDQRDSWYEETIVSVHTTEAGAYKAGLKPSFIVRPLKVKD